MYNKSQDDSVFALIIGVFNAVAIAAALLVIAPTMSQSAAIAWVVAAALAGFFIAKKKG